MDRDCRDKGLHCSQPSLRPCPCWSHQEISAFICHERRPSCSAQEIKTAPCRKGSASAGLSGVPVSYGLGWIPLLGLLGFVGLGKAPSAASGTGQGQGTEGMPGRRDRDTQGGGMEIPVEKGWRCPGEGMEMPREKGQGQPGTRDEPSSTRGATAPCRREEIPTCSSSLPHTLPNVL